MTLCSVGFVLGFTYIVASRKTFNRRKALYYLHQYVVLGFTIGMIAEGTVVGALAMLGWMLLAMVVYRRLKYTGTGLGLDNGFVSPGYSAVPPPKAYTTNQSLAVPPARERVSLTAGEEVIFAALRRQYYEDEG